MWNVDFAKITPGGVAFPLARTNALEIALIAALDHRTKVLAGEYAKYYFLLHGGSRRSGLARDGPAARPAGVAARGSGGRGRDTAGAAAVRGRWVRVSRRGAAQWRRE